MRAPRGKELSRWARSSTGETVRAADDDEVVSLVEAHVERSHPELVGRLSRADILGMAEEE